MANREYSFAVDIMCYIASKYNYDWTPKGERDALSPFTQLAKTGIEASLLEWSHVGMKIYRPLLGTPSASPFMKVSRHIVEVGIASGKDFLYVCTGVAITAIQFYASGQHDAPDIAIDVIESALHLFQGLHGTDIFRRFHLVLENLAANHNSS